MPYVRLTILRPRPAQREKAWDLLKEIDHVFTDDPGLIMSFEVGERDQSDAPLGRVAVWETNTAANEAARSERSLALRSELQQLCSEGIVENLTEITHSHWIAASQRLPTQESP